MASRKSKKDKGNNQDDEKENASSPTKVKKLDKSKKPSKLDDENNNAISDRQRKNGSPESPPSKMASPESKRPAPNKYSSQPIPSSQVENGHAGANGNAESNTADQAKRRSLRDTRPDYENQQHLTVETNIVHGSSQQPSPLSSKSGATTINIQHPRHPALSASDAANSASFVRGVSLLTQSFFLSLSFK